MNFLDWVKLSTAIDIASIVLFIAFFIKFRKLNNQLKEVRKDLDLTMVNPAVARRTLKDRKKAV